MLMAMRVYISRVDKRPCSIHYTQNGKKVIIEYNLVNNKDSLNDLIVTSVCIIDKISQDDVLYWVQKPMFKP